MILRLLSPPQSSAPANGHPKSAAEVFIQTEKQVHAPYGIIFQLEHSLLAGRLAQALVTDVFGELPPDVIQAIAQHDFGWQASDQAQMDALGRNSLRPFPAMSAEETLPSWNESVGHARSLGSLVYLIVSRHFTTLGANDASRTEFVRTETERRAAIERTLPYPLSDLDRWTSAIGFCDLLSLYLCCGCQDPVEFPIAHPADPASARARKITLSWHDGWPQFSAPVLWPGTRLSLDLRSYSGSGQNLNPLKIEWSFL